MSDVTRMLDRVRQGEVTAAEQLLPLAYEELRKLAAHKLSQEKPGQTLQPTALVHEAWLRLGGDRQPAWRNRAHFFAAAAEAMRRILIDRARRRRALRGRLLRLRRLRRRRHLHLRRVRRRRRRLQRHRRSRSFKNHE